MSDIFEYRGVDQFHFAEVIQDDENGYVCSAPIHIPVQEIGKSTDSSAEAHYYDNKAMIVVNSESADTITLTLAPPTLQQLTQMIGKSFDSNTGMMVDSPRQNKYFAIMYRTKGTDGKYRYVSRLKGQFNIPEETISTENDGTDTSNVEIEFTGIFTDFEFTKGTFDGTSWSKSGVKGIVVDSRYNLANVSNFFTSVQTPDTISSSATIGTLNVTMAEGSTSGTTVVDTVSPVTENNDMLVYKLGSSAETVAYDQDLSSWTQLSLDTNISATASQVITVAEVVSSSKKARKVGSATVVLPE